MMTAVGARAILGAARRLAGAMLAVTLAGAAATPAAAQGYPSRPITVIVAFPAGGYADSFARIVGDRLGARLGQPVVIENRSGAGGNIGAASVAHSPADGYTLLATTASIAVNETYYKNKNYTAADLRAIALPAGAPETLSVLPNHPAKKLADLVTAGRAKPFDYASPGIGTSSHVAAAYFFKVLAKIEPIHVPFQGGAPALNAALGGHVDVLVGTLPGFAPQLASGALRGLAVSSEQRVPGYPYMPTYQEGGYKGFVAESWVGIFAPAKVDDAIAIKLNALVNQIVSEPATQARLATLTMQTRVRNLADSEAYFRSEITKWGKMVDAIGLVAK